MREFVNSHLLSDATPGIYESLRVYEGIFFRIEEHLDRFFESAQTLDMKVPETRQGIRKKLEKALRDFGKEDAFVRLTLLGKEIFIHIVSRTHPPENYRRGVSLKTTVVRRNPSFAAPPEAKSTAFLNQILATLDPAPPGNYEILFLDSNGYLAEARIGNLFTVKDQRLLTPPARGLLNGVTRRFVVECARRGKIPVEERPLMRHELFNADEAFLTNTSWEILPIREVDGRQTGSKIPGPVTEELQRLFRHGVRQEIQNGKD